MDMGGCGGCPLRELGRGRVEGVGEIPADVLFLKANPSRFEELRRRYLLGPEAKILESAIGDACRISNRGTPRWYLTALVQCRPVNERMGPTREPTGEEVWTCSGRVESTIANVSPKQIILLGPVAGGYQRQFKGSMKSLSLEYILDCGGTGSTQYIEFVRELAEIFEEVLECQPRKRRLRRKQPARRL